MTYLACPPVKEKRPASKQVTRRLSNMFGKLLQLSKSHECGDNRSYRRMVSDFEKKAAPTFWRDITNKSRCSCIDRIFTLSLYLPRPLATGTFQVSVGTDVITLRNRFPYTVGFCLKSVGRREQVSLKPYAVITSEAPPSGYRLTLFAPNIISILATCLIRSYIGCVPEMLYM